MTHGFMCYIHEGDVIKGTICSLYMDNAWYSDLNSRSISLEFDIADSLSMRYLAFAISSNNYEWEVLHVQDKQNNTLASVTIPESYNGAVKLGVKLYDTPPEVGSVLNAGFDYVITGGIELTISANGKLVTMTCGTAGAIIHYTVDGTDPTEESTVYAGAFEIDHSCTIKARAYKDGLEPSNIASEEVEIIIPTCATPVITDDGNGNVTITCATSGATIYYTTNGSNPTTSSTKYTGTFTVSENCTVKAIAVASGYNNSSVASKSVVAVILPTNWVAISDMKFDSLSHINSVCYGNSKFVAVGRYGEASYSTDGITWTAIADMKVDSNTIRSICYANGKFVAVGNDSKGSYSTDGINWTAISDTKFGTSRITNIYSVCYGNGKFVAVATGGEGSYSTDGITWTAIADMKFGANWIRSVCYGNGKFVAVGNDGKGSYSTDGITWTAIADMKFGDSIIQEVRYANGKFVAVGNDGKGSYSTDGINWTAISDTKFGTSGINSVCYGNGKFVAVGDDGKGSYSTDGITWTAIADMKVDSNTIQSICYANSKFVAVSDYGEGSYCIA